jgi:hypothetical protein
MEWREKKRFTNEKIGIILENYISLKTYLAIRVQSYNKMANKRRKKSF